jgi:hypothetical protein
MRESQGFIKTRDVGPAIGARRGDLRRRATPLDRQQFRDFLALLR